VAALAARILAAALLERDDLGAALVLDDFADDAGTGDARNADVALLAVEQREHFAKDHLRPGFAFESHDGDGVGGGDLVLLAAGFDDCEHRFLRVQPGSARTTARPASWQWKPAGLRPFAALERKSKSAAVSRA